MRAEGRWSSGGVPYITAFFSCEELNIEDVVAFLIDTGASRTTILDSDAEHLGIDYSKLRRFEEGTTRIGGIVDSFIIPNVKLHFRTVEGLHEEEFKQIFVLKHSTSDKEEEQIRRLPSLLGRDFLNRYKLLLDRANDTVTITDETLKR